MRKGTLSDIEQILKGRVFSLIHLHDCIDRLMKNQLEQEAAADVNQYLSQLLADNLPASGSFHVLVLSQLLDTIAEKRSEYLQLLTCFREQDPSLGLIKLYYLLEARVAYSQLESEEFKTMNPLARARFGFHDRQLYAEVSEYLTPHLPKVLAELKKIISVKKIMRRGAGGEAHFIAGSIDLEYLREKETSMIALLMKVYHSDDGLRLTVDKYFSTDEGRKHKWAMLKKASLITRGVKDVYISLLNIEDANSNEEVDNSTALSSSKALLRQIARIYEKVVECNKYATFLETLQTRAEARNYRIKLHGVYAKAYDQLFHQCAALSMLNDRYEKKVKKLKYALSDAHYQALMDGIYELEERLIAIVADFNGSMNPDLTCEDVLHIQHKYMVELASYPELMASREEEIEKITSKLKKDVELAKQQQQKEREDAEKANMVEAEHERKRASQARKATIALDRMEKAAQKSSPVVTQPEAVSTEPTEKSINEEMMSRVRTLPRAYLDILKSIIQKGPRPNIKYTEIYSLIENHLGGEIVEIGNGSSHKRIKIASLYGEMYGCAEEETKKPCVVTGGFFVAHKKGHNDRYLNIVHIELLRKLFNSLGLTLELIAEIDKNHELIAVARRTSEVRHAKV